MESLEKAGLAVNYNRIKGTKPMSLPKEVYIWDETLRDGEQTPGVALTLDEKIEIAKMLDEIGTSIVVVGFPAVSEHEKEIVAAVAKEGLNNAVIGAPARAVKADIDACIEAGVREVPIFIATSDFRLKYQLRMTRDEMLDRLSECVQYAKDHGMIVGAQPFAQQKMSVMPILIGNNVWLGAKSTVLQGVKIGSNWAL